MNAVITGASRGIGLAVAEALALNGYNLYLCARNEERLLQSMEALRTRFPSVQVEGQAADLADGAAARTFGQWAAGIEGGVDLLVNNAGTFVQGSIGTEAEGSLETMMAVNVYSAYHLTRALLPGMKERGSGHIFNICSIASLQAYPAGGSYSISKFALLGFSKNLREELKATGIKVTAILPGAVYTDSWKGSGVAPERIMEAGDVAQLILSSSRLSPGAVPEEIVLRPQLGDL